MFGRSYNPGQQSDDPFLSDPNLHLAHSIFQSLTNLAKDELGTGEKTQENSSSQQKQKNDSEANKAQGKPEQGVSSHTTVLEMTPVNEIAEKLRGKTLLTVEELTAISQVMKQTFSDLKKLIGTYGAVVAAHRLKDYLNLVYYSIINTHAFSQSPSYLESQTLKKFMNETFSLVQSALELILPSKKKDDEVYSAQNLAVLANSLLPVALRLVSLFVGQPNNFDQVHYKYLRATNIKLETLSLQPLNQLFADLAPSLFGPMRHQSKEQKKYVSSSDLIEIPQVPKKPQVATYHKGSQAAETDEDFLLSMLDYQSNDYQALSQSLADQLWAKGSSTTTVKLDDETMSVPEDSHEEEEKVSETLTQAAQGQISKLKLVDLLSKAVDQVATLGQSDRDFLMALDSNLVSVIIKYLSTIQGLKPKNFSSFVTKTINESAQKAQADIIDYLSKLKDVDRIMNMEADSIMESVQGTENERKTLFESVAMLAKALEIIRKRESVEANQEQMIELIKTGASLRYIPKILKLDEKSLQSSEFIKSIVSSYNGAFMKLLQPGLLKNLGADVKLEYLTSLSSLVIVSLQLSLMKKNDKPLEALTLPINNPILQSTSSSAQKDKPSQQQLSQVRTRGQAKKEQRSTGSKKDAKEDKKEDPIIKEDAPQSVFIQVNADDLLKTSMSMFASLVFSTLKDGGIVQMNRTLLQNLKIITILQVKSPQFVGKILSGITGEFFKPSLPYTKESVDIMANYLLTKYQKLLQSQALTPFVIKMLFLISNRKAAHNDDHVAYSLALELVQDKWISKKGSPAKSHADMFDSANLSRYLTFVACLFAINSNPDKSQEQRINLIRKALGGFTSERLTLSLHLVQLSMLCSQSLGKLRPVIQKAITSTVSESDSKDNSIASLISDIDSAIQTLFNSQTPIYETQVLSQMIDALKTERIIDILRGINLNEKGVNESKTFINSTIKQVVKINAEFSIQADIVDDDYESYLAREYSVGNGIHELVNAKFYIHSAQALLAISQKVKSNSQLSDKEIETLNQLVRSLKYLLDRCEAFKIEKLQQMLDKAGAQMRAQLILNSQKGTHQSHRMLTLIQQALNTSSLQANSPEAHIINNMIDPASLSKHIVNHRSNSNRVEENVFAHCFSVRVSCQEANSTNVGEYQIFTSDYILIRPLFSSIMQVINNVNMSQISPAMKPIFSQIAQSLIAMRYSNMVLELNDRSVADSESQEKLLSLALECSGISLNSKDFNKLRSLDSSLSFLSQALKQEPLTPFLIDFAKDIAAQNLVHLNYKTPTDKKILQDYLSGTYQEVLSTSFEFSSQAGSEVATKIWHLAFKYLEKSQFSDDSQLVGADENSQVSKEARGGIQMEINFGASEGSQVTTSGLGKRQRKVPMKKPQNEDVKETEEGVETSQNQRLLNPIAAKLFEFLIETMARSGDPNNISTTLKKGFLDLSSASLNFIPIFVECRQLQLLKKFLLAALKDDDPDLVSAFQTILYQSLLSLIQKLGQSKDTLDSDKQALFTAVELAHLITDNSKQLIQFILEHILGAADRVLSHQSHNQVGSKLLKLLILDFLCQLTNPTYSQIEGEKARYSAQHVQERRKQAQERRRQQEEHRKLLQSQAADEEQEAQNEQFGGIRRKEQADAVGEVDGFKQERINRLADNARYMENPQEVCTYSHTKKNFSVQHWYWCYTCRLVENSGCCATCAIKCHKGHHVVYSKKSNFFCDCGDSGRCQSLSPNQLQQQPGPKEPQKIPSLPSQSLQDILGRHHQRRRIEGGPQADGLDRDVGLHSYFGGGPGSKYNPSNLFGEPEDLAFGNPPPFGVPQPFGRPPPGFLGAPRLQPPNFIPRGNEDDPIYKDMLNLESQIPGEIIQQLMPQSGLKFIENYPEEQILRDMFPKSLIKDDEDSDESDDNPDIMRLKASKFVSHAMKAIKGVPKKISDMHYGRVFAQHAAGIQIGLAASKSLAPSVSNISNINPLEDPFSDSGAMTPANGGGQLQLTFSQSNLGQEDASMSSQEDATLNNSSSTQLFKDLAQILQSSQAEFDFVFGSLIKLIEDQNTTDQEDSSMLDAIPSNVTPSQNVLTVTLSASESVNLNPKSSVALTQDLAIHKKILNQNTFQIKVQGNDIAQRAVQHNINLINVIDSNKLGLAAVCEDNEVSLYGGSQFFEDSSASGAHNEAYPIGAKDGGPALLRADTYKLSYQPLQVIFNTVQPLYLAVVGAQSADVLVLTKNGKVSYKVSIELLLEAISNDLTIVNVKWLPGSQSSLAVGTKDFIKIYDLAEDTMSPTHNIMIFNGFITDFAFTNPVEGEDPSQQARTTVLAASKSGEVFHQEISYNINSFEKKREEKDDNGDSKMKGGRDNHDLMMTEPVKFGKLTQHGSSCVSVHASQYLPGIIFLSFVNGHTLVGKIESNGDFTGFPILVESGSTFNNSPNKAIWQRYGEVMACFKDIPIQSLSDKAYVTAFSKKPGAHYNQTGIPIILEIAKDTVNVSVVRNNSIGSGPNSLIPVLGQSFVKRSNHSQSDSLRLVNILMDGAAVSYQCKFADNCSGFSEEPSKSEGLFSNKDLIVNLDQLIKKSDLPVEVKHSVNFFEKAKNLIADGALKQKLTFGGDIVTYFKTSKATVENLSKQSNSAVFNEPNKKSVKIQLKIDQNSDHVITGVRFRLDFSQCKSQQHFPSLKLFNRVVQFKNYQSNGQQTPLWFDVPFCDAEVLFGSISINHLQMELTTEDPKQCPIRVCQMEVFGLTKKEFSFKEKVKKLEKLHSEKLASSRAPASSKLEASNGNEQIKEELQRSKGLPLVAWKEKMAYLKANLPQKQIEFVETLDVITQYLGIVTQVDIQNFTALVEQLKILLQSTGKGSRSPLVQASIKRCLRKVLSILHPEAPLGHPMNYETIKDEMLVKKITARLQVGNLTIEEVQGYLSQLAKLQETRYFQLFNIFQAEPNLAEKLVAEYSNSAQRSQNDKKQMHAEIKNLMNLAIAGYQHKVNQTFQREPSASLEEAIDKTYSDQSLVEYFQLLTPVMFSDNDQTQKITVSVILSSIGEYADTMAKILRMNKLPSTGHHSCLIVDFTPHLLKFCLEKIQSGPQVLTKNQEVVYQLAFKLAKKFEINNTKSYQGKFTQHIVDPVIGFFKSLLAGQSSYNQIVVTGESQSTLEKYLYSNLVLLNCFLHQAVKDIKIKIKGSQVNLDYATQKLILEKIVNDADLIKDYFNWAGAILLMYRVAFTSQKCSYKTKIQEFITGPIYEVLPSSEANGQRALLRPIQETSQWKWHPLFTKTDHQFDLLDRKIPAQLLLSVQFIFREKGSGINALETTKIPSKFNNEVAALCFRKPCVAFLKELGEQTIMSVLLQATVFGPREGESAEQHQARIEKFLDMNYKGSSSFDEFSKTFEVLYEKKLTKPGAISFNLQFLIYSLLSKIWKRAQSIPHSWQNFILKNKKTALIQTHLFNSIFLLNDDSAQICMQLIALAFDTSVIFSARDPRLSLFQVFSLRNKAQAEDSKFKQYVVTSQAAEPFQVDVKRLVEVMLLGRNKKDIRVAAAHCLLSLYDCQQSSELQQNIKQALLDNLPQLRTKGVNSQEFIALLSHVINSEVLSAKSSGTQSESDLYKRLTREVFKQITKINQQLTGHENLEIYAVLQKSTSAFGGSSPQDSLNLDDGFMKKLLEQSRDELRSQLALDKRAQKVTNPFMLETEACQKCFAQKSLPFTQHRLADIKTEAKYTDSALIYRFQTSYEIKQIFLNQDNFRGNKVIKEISVYVNNKQGVDLADMKNNWTFWQKVTSQEVQVGQNQILIEFTLPVIASNLLIQLNTINSSKNMHKSDRERPNKGPRAVAPPKANKPSAKASKVESIHQVSGIDTVLSTLPKAIAANLGIVQASGSSEGGQDQANGSGESEHLMCPRCGRQVQGRHGVCNSCGENAQQCPHCRNINYEKPDGFICTDCGNSRFVRLDIQVILKQGFAAEKIETEDQKAAALVQIEQNLQSAQTNYSQLMKKRSLIHGLIRKFNEGSNECSKMAADMYTDECADLYQKMMKSLGCIKVLKMEIDKYTGQMATESEQPVGLQSLQLRKANSAFSTPEDEQVQENCFSCIQEYLRGLLNFVQATSDSLSAHWMSQGILDLLYKENIKMYSAALQDPARKAICQILKSDEQNAVALLSQIQKDLFEKSKSIPAHILASNINQETYLVLDLLKLQATLKGKGGASQNYYKAVLSFSWKIFFQSLNEGESLSAIAEQVSGTFIAYFRELLKNTNEWQGKETHETILSLFSEPSSEAASEFRALQQEFMSGKNFLIHCLTMKSSIRVRNEAKEIVQVILQTNKELHSSVLRALLSILDKVLGLEAAAGDQYFELLKIIFEPSGLKEKITEQSLKKDSESHIYIEAFDLLFKQIESELNKLVIQEKARRTQGSDGYMPQISTGQIFARIVSLVSSMIKESPHLKAIIQDNVFIVIKSFLKVRKLNLTKNKVVQQSEVEIEKMFKELHSQRDEEKENFLLQCLKIMESGDCDHQELRFLFEEMCKVVDPVKPEPEYLLHLTRAQSQEFYFKGKMSKNPYLSGQLGKTMADVRLKIAKEMELAEPELLELLVQNKIVGMDLTMRQVYEQVHWPSLCKQRDPDAYDIPPIDEAPKSQLQPMQVIYRLMGIDGEATEDRVESLQDGSEADLDPANINKKYGITKVMCQEFPSKRLDVEKTTGVEVLLSVLDNLGALANQRYLAEWLFKLIGHILKIKSNRLEFLKYKQTVDHLAKRLFESVGMQSQIEGQKGVTLFDVILGILDQIIVELNQQQDQSSSLEADKMEIDLEGESMEAASHVQLFIQIMSDSCTDMVAANQALDKTSKKIKAISKILPFLINKEDASAQRIIIDFIAEALNKIPLLDNLAEMTAKEKFNAQFNLERVIEIFESIPVTKNYLKDAIQSGCGQLLTSMWKYLHKTTLANLANEASVFKHKLANFYTLRVILSLMKNHPLSQGSLFDSHKELIERIYELTQTKYQEKQLTILANDIVESFTSKNHINHQALRDTLQRLKDKQNDDKKKLALLKRQQIMAEMERKKKGSAFIQQLSAASQQEETGPKCIVCQDGYTKKPTDVLGMYVFSKKHKISEISASGNGFTTTMGYCTVTHSHYIHFTCHQNAYRADSQMKQPKKEWEGAAIRNDHTKCNNLFPIQGGSLPLHSYGDMVERYFQLLQKQVGTCDPDRVKVLSHDFKILLKRLAYEDSFSRDSQGGGPEHNMHLVPFLVQMIHYHLAQGTGYMQYGASETARDKFTYAQEQRLAQFLDQGVKQRKDFLRKVEEEKRPEELEEEYKAQSANEEYDDESSSEAKAASGGAQGDDEAQSNFSLDQIAFMLSQAVIFCQLPQWEKYKYQFFTIMLCTVAGMKDEKPEEVKPIGQQTDYATGKRFITIGKQDDEQMTQVQTIPALSSLAPETGAGGKDSAARRRLSSDTRTEILQRALFRLRPLLIFLRLVDSLKTRWDSKRLGITSTVAPIKHEDYLKRLSNELLTKGNLQDVISECDELFKDYKDRMLRTSSVEDFLRDMGMLDSILAQSGAPAGSSTTQALEHFILSHFSN